MKNYEKYADVMKKLHGAEWCDVIAKPNALKSLGIKCANISCSQCGVMTTLWLLEDYEEPEEPEVDWSKVEVDTPILVRTVEWAEWARRYFAKYEDRMVYVWNLGRTSWSATNDKDVSAWPYAKLAESEEE